MLNFYHICSEYIINTPASPYHYFEILLQIYGVSYKMIVFFIADPFPPIWGTMVSNDWLEMIPKIQYCWIKRFAYWERKRMIQFCIQINKIRLCCTVFTANPCHMCSISCLSWENAWLRVLVTGVNFHYFRCHLSIVKILHQIFILH